MAEENNLDELIAKLPSRNVRDLAAYFELKIRFAQWHPVTAGEILHEKNEIVVNRNASMPSDKIIAHEIGHFILRQEKLTADDAEEFCDRFAEELLSQKL